MTGPVASLNTAWFAWIGLLWTGYFVLEGFDFGVGVLSLLLGRDDLDRRLCRNATTASSLSAVIRRFWSIRSMAPKLESCSTFPMTPTAGRVQRIARI